MTAVQSWLPANIAGLPDGTEVQVSGALTNVMVAETKQGRRWAEAHVARADEHGSSDRAVGFGRWDDEHLSVVSGSPDDGWYHLRRVRLGEYMDALDRDDEAAAQAVLECWERFEGVDPVEN